MIRIGRKNFVSLLTLGACAVSAQDAPVQVTPAVATITCMSAGAGTRYTDSYTCGDQECGRVPYFDPGLPVVAKFLAADVATSHFNLVYAEIFKQSSKLLSIVGSVSGRVATLEAGKSDPIDAARLKLLEARVKELEHLSERVKQLEALIKAVKK